MINVNIALLKVLINSNDIIHQTHKLLLPTITQTTISTELNSRQYFVLSYQSTQQLIMVHNCKVGLKIVLHLTIVERKCKVQSRLILLWIKCHFATVKADSHMFVLMSSGNKGIILAITKVYLLWFSKCRGVFEGNLYRCVSRFLKRQLCFSR